MPIAAHLYTSLVRSMYDAVGYDQPERSNRWKRWSCLLAVILLLTGCLFWTGLFLYLPVLPQIWANHLSRVQGKAELIAPAQWGYARAVLSPDGRWIVLFDSAAPAKAEAPMLWDLMSGERYPINSSLSNLRWLNDEYFVVNGGERYPINSKLSDLRWLNDEYFVVNGDTPRPYLVNVNSRAVVSLEYIPTDTYLRPGGFQVIEPLLRKAQELYITPRWGADYKVFTLVEGRWYFITLSSYEFNMTQMELDRLVTTIPHVEVSPYGKNSLTTTNQRIYSPDNRFYATWEGGRTIDETGRVAIYTRDGELVAQAHKAGWDPYVLGWAQDGSGVYFRMLISGSVAQVLVPYRPLFKLSPLTPLEALLALISTIVLWGCGVALVADIVRWRWRLRRQRAS